MPDERMTPPDLSDEQIEQRRVVEKLLCIDTGCAPWNTAIAEAANLIEDMALRVRALEDRIAELNQNQRIQDATTAAVMERAEASAKDAERLELMRNTCRIVYSPEDGSYPIEHSKLANKDSWDMLIAAIDLAAKGQRHG